MTFLAHDHPEIAAALDIYSRITATRRGVSGTYRVVGIQHDITVTTWTITLDLTEDI